MIRFAQKDLLTAAANKWNKSRTYLISRAQHLLIHFRRALVYGMDRHMQAGCNKGRGEVVVVNHCFTSLFGTKGL